MLIDPFSLNGLNRENVTLKSSGKQPKEGWIKGKLHKIVQVLGLS